MNNTTAAPMTIEYDIDWKWPHSNCPPLRRIPTGTANQQYDVHMIVSPMWMIKYTVKPL